MLMIFLLLLSYVSDSQNALLSPSGDQSKLFVNLKSSLIGFTLEQLPHFLGIVQRVASNYFATRKAILNDTHTHVICKITPKSIRDSLGLSKSQCQALIPFTESEVLQVFRKANLEYKNKLFHTIFKTPVPLETLITPLSSELFINPVISTISS